jgi:hypothetical protein
MAPGGRERARPGERARTQQIFLRQRGQRRAHVPLRRRSRPASLTCCGVVAIAPPGGHALVVITGRKEEAMTEAELAIVRRAYAKQVMAPFNVVNPRARRRSPQCAVKRSSAQGHGRSCTRVAM